MQPVVGGYDEFRIRIDRRDGAPYHVFAEGPSAEASSSFELPFDQARVEDFGLNVVRGRGGRGGGTPVVDGARRLGGELFKALFRADVGELYRATFAQAHSQGRGVRITLCLSGAPELIDVPWEYLYDEPNFLALSAVTPIVRYLDLPRSYRPLTVDPPLRVLGIVSSPEDREPLDVNREKDHLRRALSGLTTAGTVELQWLERPTLGALLKALQEERFHAIHYIGHGAYDRASDHGALLLEDDSGFTHAVRGDELGTVLHDFSSVRLVVLNACEGARGARSDPFAGVAGALVQRDIPAVVAMQFEISDEAATVFAGGFYRPLAAGLPVDASLAAARLEMLAERSDDLEWGTPVLFMRVPDGRIFDLDGRGLPAGDGGPSPSAQSSPNGSVRVYVNYRQDDDAGHALALTDRLRQHYGHVGDGMPTGDNGRQDGQHADVNGGAVVLALIGAGWLESVKAAAARRHVDDPGRREIERALRDLPERVIPVLIDATMPEPELLPRSLRALCRAEPARLRHATFDQDLPDLIEQIDRTSRKPPRAARRDGEITRRLTPVTSQVPAGGIAGPYADHIAEVVRGLLSGTVVPVLGPGIRSSARPNDHLSGPLAEQFETGDSGLAEVAQRVAVTLGERRLYTVIKDLVQAQSEPTDVDLFLADLPGTVRRLGVTPSYPLIISANYDSGLERAFEAANEPFDYALYLADSGWFLHVPWGEREPEPTAITIVEPRTYIDFPIGDDGELERTVIVKIHGGVDGREGDVTWRNNYVVTEDHYIDYLPTHSVRAHLPIQILDKLTGSRCLFLGYALRDWDARVFLRRIWNGQPITESSWAIEPNPDALEKALWSVVGHVELIAAQLPDYVASLGAAMNDHPAVR